MSQEQEEENSKPTGSDNHHKNHHHHHHNSARGVGKFRGRGPQQVKKVRSGGSANSSPSPIEREESSNNSNRAVVNSGGGGGGGGGRSGRSLNRGNRSGGSRSGRGRGGRGRGRGGRSFSDEVNVVSNEQHQQDNKSESTGVESSSSKTTVSNHGRDPAADTSTATIREEEEKNERSSIDDSSTTQNRRNNHFNNSSQGRSNSHYKGFKKAQQQSQYKDESAAHEHGNTSNNQNYSHRPMPPAPGRAGRTANTSSRSGARNSGRGRSGRGRSFGRGRSERPRAQNSRYQRDRTTETINATQEYQDQNILLEQLPGTEEIPQHQEQSTPTEEKTDMDVDTVGEEGANYSDDLRNSDHSQAEQEAVLYNDTSESMIRDTDATEQVEDFEHPNPYESDSPAVEDTANMETKPRPVLSLPAIPHGKSNGGKLMILSRATAIPKVSAPAEQSDDASVGSEDRSNQESKKKKLRKKIKKVQTQDEEEPPQNQSEVENRSTVDALRALPAREVSITAATTIRVRTSDNLLGPASLEDGQSSTKVGASDKSGKKKGKSKKKKKSLSTDSELNRKAVQQFNRLVHQCVLQSDAITMRELLHDPRNHNFALDPLVLETVMKAYVMAAMFEDALYCLRHCALPGTLQTIQTERILSCLPQNLRNSSAYTAADMINELCIATDFDSPTSRTYFLRIVRGISLEFLEEATSARDRICSSPCERLVRSGLCVVNAQLKRGKKPADLVVVPGDQLGVFVPDTLENRGIQAGDAVSILPYAGPYPMSAESLDRNMIEATVTNTNPMVLRLQDKANLTLYSDLTYEMLDNLYRIDKLANRMGFNRQLAAAVAIASPLGDPPLRDPRRPSPELVRAITAMDENIDLVMRASQGGKLPKGEMTSTAALCAQAIPFHAEDESKDMDQDAIRSECRLALEKYGALEGLNGSQMLAVEGATSNRLTLVQGPPGTGKTLVAIRILQHWARLTQASAYKGETAFPILATSDSNIAVDNLVEGCAGVGIRVVRLGRPESIRPELLRYCIDRPPSSYSSETSTTPNAGTGVPPATVHRERVRQIRNEIKNAQVICCTCIGSGGDILDAMTFDRVLVDEATQATEPAVLVPLMRGCRQLVLVGDHCQLPPTVLSTRAEEEGHGVPLFSRMVACGVPPFMLDTQYRMHPRIAMFPSDLFYGGLLKNGVSAPERRPLPGFPWPVEEFPVAFIPIKGVEMDDGVSKYNEDEAAAACNAVSMLMAGGLCRVSDIAVVTPYAAQAKLIRRMTRRLQENSGPPYIEVSSVDGFQGREKEAVVFSAVRSNDYGAIGFTSDWRRVNVSFTRARRALIVIGNDATLRRGDPETWGPWLAWADAHGLNMDKPGVPRGRYDPEQLRRVRGGTTAAEMLKDVLERQHAQLKIAEKQQERAVKNSKGHIRATSEDHSDKVDNGGKALTLEEDLAQMENADGHWDDSDDEEGELHHSPSKATLTSHSSQDRSGDDESNAVLDVWDL